jgi:hypothetical protein
MQECYESVHHNLLPGATPDSPDDIGINRARHLGEMMLSKFRDEIQSPVEFARKCSGLAISKIQAHMLNAAATNPRVLILNAPGTGASTAAAIFALHRTVARRNHRALIISPQRNTLGQCRSMLKSNSWLMIDAWSLFSIHTETGFWANEDTDWGIHWASFSDLPVHHIQDIICNEHTIIVDNAHQYTPEFLLLLQSAIQPHQQLIIIGRDTNTALQQFEHDPEFATVRARIDQSPLVIPAFVNMKRAQYRDYPEAYQQIFQMPISWEPSKCPA